MLSVKLNVKKIEIKARSYKRIVMRRGGQIVGDLLMSKIVGLGALYVVDYEAVTS